MMSQPRPCKGSWSLVPGTCVHCNTLRSHQSCTPSNSAAQQTSPFLLALTEVAPSVNSDLQFTRFSAEGVNWPQDIQSGSILFVL